MSSRPSPIRRFTRPLVVATTLAGLAVGAAPAAAEPQFNNGVYVSLFATSPVTGLRHAATSWFAGYIGETTDPAFPRVGEIFYIRGIVANTSGSLNDAPIMSFVFDPQLEPDVEYAVSAQNPVRCLFYPDINEDGQPDPGSCRQTPEPGLTPRSSFFGGGRQLQPGQGFEVRVPVRVRAPKNGLASGGAARFGVHVQSSHGAGLAVQSLVVTPAPAAPTPPTPAATPPPATTPPPPAAPPSVDTVAPRVSRLAAVVSRQLGTTGRRAVTLRLRLSESARVRLELQRRTRVGTPFRPLGTAWTRRLAAGARSIAVGRLAPGSYRIVVQVRDAAGNPSVAATSFAVRRRMS